MEFKEAAQVFPEYKKSLKADIAYLKGYLALLRRCEDKIITSCRTHIARPDDQDFAIFFWSYFTLGDSLDDIQKELARKERHLRILSGKSSASDNLSGLIAQAKDHPIDGLIEFKRGFARCLWHEEKSGSLYYYKKSNRVKCFGCQKSADAIDVYMKLYSVSFREAVQQLIGR